jgi:peptidoglycan/xylan/chitin deacetylase (PgdA/CDA1 family)
MLHRYFIKTPWWLKRLYSSYVWNMPAKDKTIYLTFDDGPHPTITSFVVEELKKYNASATFFCIGKNVVEYQDVFKKIISEGHAIGNHTHHHLNGWETETEIYLNDVEKASEVIASKLFRPPYGRIKKEQARKIIANEKNIIMWDVLSADFDQSISKEQCLQNVLKNTRSGSIIVFHDSDKAWEKLSFVLPEVLKHFSEKGYTFKKIEVQTSANN